MLRSTIYPPVICPRHAVFPPKSDIETTASLRDEEISVALQVSCKLGLFFIAPFSFSVDVQNNLEWRRKKTKIVIREQNICGQKVSGKECSSCKIVEVIWYSLAGREGKKPSLAKRTVKPIWGWVEVVYERYTTVQNTWTTVQWLEWVKELQMIARNSCIDS